MGSLPPAVERTNSSVGFGSPSGTYHLRCHDDLHRMLKAHGDWIELRGADEQKPAKGSVEAWVDLCGEPYLMLAVHVAAPSKRLIFLVDNTKDTAQDSRSRGWKSDGAEFEIPDGPCVNFSDANGNGHAIL